MRGGGISGVTSDAFLRTHKFRSFTFDVDGTIFSAGDLNYTGVGAWNVAYTGSQVFSYSLATEAVWWNLGQFAGLVEKGSGMGQMHNLTTIPSNTLFMLFGSHYAK